MSTSAFPLQLSLEEMCVRLVRSMGEVHTFFPHSTAYYRNFKLMYEERYTHGFGAPTLFLPLVSWIHDSVPCTSAIILTFYQHSSPPLHSFHLLFSCGLSSLLVSPSSLPSQTTTVHSFHPASWSHNMSFTSSFFPDFFSSELNIPSNRCFCEMPPYHLWPLD